jgi:hypothetical protein
MFKNKTLIVVGAGASNEVNLPTGLELKNKIASILDFKHKHFRELTSGDNIVFLALKEANSRVNQNAIDLGPYLKASWRIRDGIPLSISIDNFIDAHQGDKELELCGKLAIVRSILEEEKKSLLYCNPSVPTATLNYQALEFTWYNAFMMLLTENCVVQQLDDRLSCISLIVFNYDRCIEHFLYHSLQTYYGIDQTDAASLVKKIQIYHPYGTVGALPWYGGEHTITFGGETNPKQLLDLAGQIKTFTEGTDPNSSEVTEIRRRFTESQIVLFLGFAYHKLNLDLIRPPSSDRHPAIEKVRYFGTAKGISDSDCGVICSDLRKLAGARREKIMIRNDLTCGELFKEYWRSLSLS